MRPRLVICYQGRGGFIELTPVTPRSACERHEALARELRDALDREIRRVEAEKAQLPLFDEP